jgi:thioesterase domain-containing protein
MADKRSLGRDLARLENQIDNPDDPDDADRVAAYWNALIDAVRDAEAGDGDRDRADLPDEEAFFPASATRDDIMDAFDREDATWGDAVKRSAERRDQQDADDNVATEGE